MTSLLPPTWVASAAELQKLAKELSKWPRLAVDTESNSLHAYREHLCLIQFSTPKTDYLVDSLALDDLSPLAPIFQNPKIEKVFHAAEYDLICLKRDFGITVVNLFDTMQAGRILGYQLVGLDSMLANKLAVTLNKRYQKADWGERPLSKEMLNYARLDTHYLLALRDRLEKELRTGSAAEGTGTFGGTFNGTFGKRGRWDLAREEFVRLAQGNGNGSGKPEAAAWQHVKGTQKFTGRQLAVLQELCAWRQARAEQMNRPVFKVIDDKRLLALTVAAPRTLDELERAGLTPRQIHAFGSDILQAIRRGRKAAPLNRPPISRPQRAYLDRLNALTEWRKEAAKKMGVESDLVLPKGWMAAIAGQNPHSLAELADLMPQSPWRLKNFGRDILTIIQPGHPKEKSG